MKLLARRASWRTTIVYVTHDQVEAMTLADRIVVLRDGAVAQVGTPLELYDNPDNLFVAGFIGSPKMNFLRGVVETSGPAGLSVALPDLGGQILNFPVSAASIAKGAPLTLGGPSPEHFNETALACEARAYHSDIIEHLGGETFAYASYGQGEVITIRVHNGRALKAGQAIEARFDPQAVLLFDAGGQRIR